MPEAGLSTDVIVCGGGFAGLTAAVSALEAGARVVLCEKGPEVGGSSVISGGMIWTFKSLDDLYATVPDGNHIVQQLVFDRFSEDRSWLASQGAELTDEGPMLGHGWGQEMDPPQALGVLRDRFVELEGELLLETALDALAVSDGRIRGIRVARSDGSIRELTADAVILATGGFQGNPELLTRYVVDSPDSLYLRGNPWSTGDAFLAATDIGAAATPGMETFYGHALTAPPARFSALEFQDVSQYYGRHAVAINMRGRRFADESGGLGEEYINSQLARQPGGRGFYVVDRTIAEMEAVIGMVHTRPILERARDYSAPVVFADSLENLADGLAAHGVPSRDSLRTLEEFNAACLAQEAPQMSPPRAKNHFPLVNPPFTAVGVKAAITFTMGGLAVDDSCRVLRRAASSSPIAQSITELRDFREVPLAGLYAAGCDVGNVHHESYIGGLATGLTTGRVAGLAAAAVGSR